MSRSSETLAFQDIFSSLFSGASGAAGSALMGAGELSGFARQLFTGGLDVLDSLGGDAGSAYLADRLSSSNPVLADSLAALEEDTGRFYREQIRPEIVGRGVATGNLGGGRQGIADAMGVETATREFTRGALQLRQADIAQRDAIAESVADRSLTGAGLQFQALPELLGLAERGNNQSLGIYSTLSDILGSPITLSESIAEQFARSFSEERSNSSSKGKSFSLGLT